MLQVMLWIDHLNSRAFCHGRGALTLKVIQRLPTFKQIERDLFLLNLIVLPAYTGIHCPEMKQKKVFNIKENRYLGPLFYL